MYLWLVYVEGESITIVVINKARVSNIKKQKKTETPCIRWLGINSFHQFDVVWCNSGLEQSYNSRPDA